MELGKYIRSIPDYPKKGILFRDITTLIKNKQIKSAIKFYGKSEMENNQNTMGESIR